MKTALGILFLLFAFSDAVGQSFRIQGTLRSQEMGIAKADIANTRTQKHATSAPDGSFSIDVALNDVLYIVHPDFEIKKITIVSETVWLYDIELTPKAIQLDEVAVDNLNNVNVSVSPGEQRLAEIKKEEMRSYTGVYDGSMPYGVNFDFVSLFKGIGKLFKKKKEEPTANAESLDQFIDRHFTEDYWTTTLRLKPEEKVPFLKFCMEDPQLQTLLARENGLELTEFFLQKKKAFQAQTIIVAPRP
ncbi:hypothetical protein [Flavobacterium sp.]|jgi:hypothetical protein|uniref:hypothetical protein n=1 Tax=Flavobacterium sp. TaxID=239 RepID=UPI0022C883EE|nr:hypothetical protein [Flavobacterium sp.]MCZ8144791.1 hypothetical protein [Flavobacterium sp.]MCZ8367146.1 hypothetical protein [Flavobacterium sp.]